MARLLVLIAAAGAFLVPTARAATVIGDSTTSPIGGIPEDTVFVQSADGVGAPYAFPTAGVVTSMSATGANSSSGTRMARVLVARGTPVEYTAIGGTNLTFTTTTQALKSAPTRIPVQAGDRLGGYTSHGLQIGIHSGGGNVAASPRSIAPPDGSTFDAPASGGANISVSATLEPDADSDGYGDETQDSCPTLAQIHAGPCATDLQVTATANPAGIVQGQATAIVATVTNAGTQPASATTATVSAPAGLEVLASSAADGLGDIPAGASRKVYVVVRGTAVGTAPVTIAVASAVAESVPGDNTVTTPVTVTAAPTVTPPAAIKLCTVPKLKGKTKTAARKALTKAGCKAGKVRGKKGKVRTQTVPAKTKVLAGTKVGFRIRR